MTEILESPENYIDSRKFVSWERYFTKLLMDKTSLNEVWRYSKKNLNGAYISAHVLESAKKVMRLIYWE